MSMLYADSANVVEALKQAVDSVDIGDDAVTVSVYDSESVMDGLTRDEVDERNLFGYLGDHICSFEYDGTRLTVTFHQSQIDGEFTLTPADTDAVMAHQQATSPKTLASTVGEILRSVEREWDIMGYDFTEVSAGSIGNGHFTDFEFEYVVTSTEF